MIETVLHTLARIPNGAVWLVLAIGFCKLLLHVLPERDPALRGNQRNAATTVGVALALAGIWLYGVGFYLAALIGGGIFFLVGLLVAVVAEIGKHPLVGPGFAAVHAFMRQAAAVVARHWLLTACLSLLIILSSAWLMWLLYAPFGAVAAFIVNFGLIAAYLKIIERRSRAGRAGRPGMQD